MLQSGFTMLSDISQTQKDKYQIFSPICASTKDDIEMEERLLQDKRKEISGRETQRGM